MAPSVAVVGATGAVGEILRQVLDEHSFPFRAIKFLASERSAGKTLTFKGKTYSVEPLRPEAFAGVDIVLSSTPALVSREYSPVAARAGAIVIDNSSAWRMDPEVPLVVPVLEGRVESPATFAREVLERFRNPFVEHKLADIAAHHADKVQVRLVPTRDEYRARFGRNPPLLDEVLALDAV